MIELNRPKVYNCLTREMLSSIRSAIDFFERGGSVRAVVITAAGKHFCTGAALDEVEIARGSPDHLQGYLAHGHAVLDRLQQVSMPIVAAVQGLCLAGGIELALACDVLFAADDAKFGDQHAAFGLIPGWGGSQRLTRAIGLHRSLDMMFSARRIDAQTALDWGLVNYVSGNGNLHHDALDYARVLSTRNGDGLAAMKRLAYLAAADRLAAGLHQEREEALPILMGKNVDEGLNAFKERRTPKFA
jgi:enoyl-CoA hydratase